MKKYKLIKEYPGSPPLNTIAEPSGDVKYTYPNNEEHFESSSSGNLFKKLIENQPEFWEEVVEKDYEILEIVNAQIYLPDELKDLSYSGDLTAPPNIIFKLNKSKTEFDSSYCSSPLDYDTSIFYIWKVKRLSDGEVFTVGDKVRLIFNKTSIVKIINKIALEKIGCQPEGLYIYTEEEQSTINNYVKVKQPLFTTEDGVDIFDPRQKVFSVSECDFKLQDHQDYGWIITRDSRKKYHHFSTKEKAEEYILMNKPCLSVQDVLDSFSLSPSATFDNLKTLVKTRL